MQVGFAEVNITPPLGLQIPGYGPKRRLSTGVMDELFAKAMVVENEGVYLAFVVLDIIFIEQSSADQIRKRVNFFTDIPEEHVMISCTHTHTGAPWVEGPAEKEYLEHILEKKAADAITLAFSQLQKAIVHVGKGHEDRIAFNRRFYMKDGSLRTNPGIRNPDIVEPEGSIDPEVIVMHFQSLEGQTLGVVSNYAVHTDTVGGTKYCADYPAVVSDVIKSEYGDQAVSLFMQGACGNINHHDVSGALDAIEEPHYQRMGRLLGGEIIRVCRQLNEAQPLKPPISLKAMSKFVTLSERYPYPDEIEWAGRYLTSIEGRSEQECAPMEWMDKARAEKILVARGKPVSTGNYEIQVMIIGETAIVALPSEVFVELGLRIKEASPYQYTIINELANGSGRGYICTEEAIARGGYEPNCRSYDEQAGHQIVEAAIDLLGKLHQG